MFWPPLSTLPTAASGDAWSLIMAIRCGTSILLIHRPWRSASGRPQGAVSRTDVDQKRRISVQAPCHGEKRRRAEKFLRRPSKRVGGSLLRRRNRPLRAAVIADSERPSVRFGGVADRHLRRGSRVRV